MTPSRILLCLVGLLSFQSAVLPLLELPIAMPDMALIITIYVGLSSSTEKGTITGFAAGIIQDAFSGAIPGLHSFVKSFVGFLGPSLSTPWISSIFFVRLWAMSLLTGLHGLILFGMSQALASQTLTENSTNILLQGIFSQIASNLFFWLLLSPILKWALPAEEP